MPTLPTSISHEDGRINLPRVLARQMSRMKHLCWMRLVSGLKSHKDHPLRLLSPCLEVDRLSTRSHTVHRHNQNSWSRHRHRTTRDPPRSSADRTWKNSQLKPTLVPRGESDLRPNLSLSPSQRSISSVLHRRKLQSQGKHKRHHGLYHRLRAQRHHLHGPHRHLRLSGQRCLLATYHLSHPALCRLQHHIEKQARSNTSAATTVLLTSRTLQHLHLCRRHIRSRSLYSATDP